MGWIGCFQVRRNGVSSLTTRESSLCVVLPGESGFGDLEIAGQLLEMFAYEIVSCEGFSYIKESCRGPFREAREQSPSWKKHTCVQCILNPDHRIVNNGV